MTLCLIQAQMVGTAEQQKRINRFPYKGVA